MIRFLLLFTLCCGSGFWVHAQEYEDEVYAYRKSLVQSMVDYTENPPVQWKDTLHMNYYPIDSSWIITASLEPFSKDTFINMPTTAGTEKIFKVIGRVTFTVRDTTSTLTVFQPLQGSLMPYFFIPFKDGTSGLSTYGGGRYLEGPMPAKDAKTLTLDFNKAYNPWCAFNEGYFCPLPPTSNQIELSISAGEKQFMKDGKH